MCTWIVEKAPITGSGKGAQGWFTVNQANVAFDHPNHAPFEHAVCIDFVDRNAGPSARVAVELDAESAMELVKAIMSALETGGIAHGEAVDAACTPLPEPVAV